MASFNRVILLGNLTRDIELRYTTSGMAIGDTGIAVNDRRKNQAGEWVDEPTFVDLKFFGRTAEIAGEYLSKGSPIHIEGHLKLDTWEKDGQKRSRLYVIVDRMQLLGGKSSEGGGRPKAAATQQVHENYAEAHASAGADHAYQGSGGDHYDSGNIPF
jgi:single-strand DNA-binding protein